MVYLIVFVVGIGVGAFIRELCYERSYPKRCENCDECTYLQGYADGWNVMCPYSGGAYTPVPRYCKYFNPKTERSNKQ